MSPPVVSDSLLRTAPGVMACEFGDGLAILHHDSGTFFVLDEVAAYIWELLAEPASERGVAAAVEREYDAPSTEIERDVRAFVAAMIDARLIETSVTAA